MKTDENGGNEMNERTNIDDFLTVRGYGNTWDGGGTIGPVFQHAIDSIKQETENQADCTRTVIGLQNAAARQAFEGLERSNQFTAIQKAIVDSEFRSQDRQRDSDRENAANFREITARLCAIEKQQAVDTGKLAAEHAAILEKIASNKEIAELRAELQTQKIFATCGCGCGGGVRPCPGS